MSRLFAAHVHGGVIVVDGLDLPDGTPVTVVAESEEAAFTLSTADLAELDRAIVDADHHEPVPFEDVLADLDRLEAAARRR